MKFGINWQHFLVAILENHFFELLDSISLSSVWHSQWATQEKKAIDGYKFIDSPESLELQVLVRSGSDFKIHPDQCRQWSNFGGTITQELLSLWLKMFKILS